MIDPGASAMTAVRAVFIIDPSRAPRAMVHYPLIIGRFMQESLRVIEGLQATDKSKL